MTARPQLCVGALAWSDDRLLMVRRAHPPDAHRWSLPGGRVEGGETLHEAVVREVREETGLDVICDELVGWVERLDEATDTHFVILDFSVVCLDLRDPVAASDALEASWVPRWQVNELDLADGLLDFLADHRLIDVL